MGRLIIDIPQEVFAEYEVGREAGEHLLEELNQQSQSYPEPNPEKVKEALERLTGIWSDRFSPQEAVEYVNEIRRLGGRPD